jgi:galactose mutarotase-like enzyme
LHASYDDTWCGGWDELFPNDEAATLEGRDLPDHGELWTGSWQPEIIEEAHSVSLSMRYRTPMTRFLAEKTIELREGSSVLEVRYRLTNQGLDEMPFLWKLHPAFAVSPSHRIDFPPMSVRLEPDFPGTLAGAPVDFAWPSAPMPDMHVDLRKVPDVSSRAVRFFYGTGFTEGWCGITNCATGLAVALRFDPQVFSSCWLFATHGGWRDLNVVVLEPATGYPFNIHSMIEAGRARRLAPGESLESTVLFSVQEGLTAIGGVTEDGRIIQGE